jgi:trimethylamine--corrinoid protein Co-methyltransferase
VESWEEAGSKDMRMLAFERWNGMLEAYVPPPIDDDRRGALEDYVARRKSELPDAWY